MSDTPVTDAVNAELRPYVDAKSLDVFDIAMDKMAKLEGKLIEARARLEVNATPYDGIATRDETIRLLEREVAALKAAKVEGLEDAIGAIGDLLEHLPTLWGDEVVEGELMLRVESNAVTRALDAVALFAAPAAPQRDALVEMQAAADELGIDEAPQRDASVPMPRHHDANCARQRGGYRCDCSLSIPLAMLPNDHHPGPRCSCRECRSKWPDESFSDPKP